MIVLVISFSFLTYGYIPQKGEINVYNTEIEEKSGYILYGIDNLNQSSFDILKNKKVALLYNEQSKTYDNKDILDLMLDNGIDIKLLMFPEHGPKAALEAGEKFDNGTYKAIEYISLYSDESHPSNEDLKDIDMIVFDLQDIGSKYYTYISTMTNVMEVACKNNIEFIILDRPNPLNGENIEGPFNLDFSFVGMHKIPLRHGMTYGELAYMILDEGWIDCDGLNLTIVPMVGWDREKYFDEYSNYWNSPSPNIQTVDAAIAYNGMCLLEGTNLSEGRGTDKPFLKFGAPWVHTDSLLIKLDKYSFEGIELIPIEFVPSTSKFKDQECSGLELVITDRDSFHPLKFSIILLKTMSELYPNHFEINTSFLRKLYGSSDLDCILSNPHCMNNDLSRLFDTWIDISTKFTGDRKKYLLY